ncbi:MAG: Nif3-like dinuclear metal center hexameric protein [Lachnospiraceae bacterium]|nr:Nif3-like dinuclear metal center hexameric protein [Lachnospiraceae bacterium]
MRCKDLIAKLEQLSPAMYAMEWDNSGLLLGDAEKEIRKVLISVDITDEVIDEAVRHGADMIIAHHPLIFSKINKVVATDLTGRRIIRMIENGICCYCMHTNFDVMGMADEAAERLGLIQSEVLMVTYEDDISKEGIGRYGFLKDICSLKELAELVKQQFALNHVTVYGEADTRVAKAAISTGSGKSMIKYALKTDCDVIITGDIDYHSALDSVAQGLCIIDAGHFGLEKIFIRYLKEYLQREATTITAVESVQDEIGYVV